MVLIPEGTTDIWCIGLLETLCKVVEALIDTRLCASLQFHDVLHGFRAVRGAGAAIMELKLSKYLSSIYCNPLFLVFLDLSKSYDTVDRYRPIHTLKVYGAGPFLCGLLENLWAHQKVVPRQNGYHGPSFPATWWMTQGSLVSPTLFNAFV